MRASYRQSYTPLAGELAGKIDLCRLGAYVAGSSGGTAPAADNPYPTVTAAMENAEAPAL